jgi:hypothetical protein
LSQSFANKNFGGGDFVDDSISFVTLVKLRPGAGSPQQRGREITPTAWKPIQRTIESLSAHIKMFTDEDGRKGQVAFNVLGNDYDLLIIGTAPTLKTLAKVDAALKTMGYEAKTHPAVQSDEYAKLAEETEQTLVGRIPERREAFATGNLAATGT